MIRERRDRRRWERRTLDIPCKLLHALSGRYLHGRTCNVSEGGALLVLAAGRPLLPGERLELGLMMEAKPMIESAGLRAARVVWADLAGEGQRVAVEYESAAD